MKKILTLLLTASIFSSSFAQKKSSVNDNQNSIGTYSNSEYNNNQNNNNQNSALVVNASSRNGFTVSVDNGNGYPSNSNTVKLRTLSPGNHIVTVTEYTKSILGRQVPRVIYNSTINFKGGIETTLNVDNNGQVNITERQISGNSNGNGNNGKAKKMKKNKYPHDNRNGDKVKKNGHGNNDRNDD